ncbi:MAG: DUF1801 domain-containing protein [Campylobacteraceae bacterium]|nr:DUF1801 domain-containing protein [Campylobacteraceae bacterium]
MNFLFGKKMNKMTEMSLEVQDVLDSCPIKIKNKLLFLRELIIDISNKENIKDLKEELKWGELSYLCKNGSTIRIAYNKNKKNEYGIYFNCKTKLVKTFRVLFFDIFTFEDNRAIKFQIDEKIALKELKYCILLALTYHKRKHLLMLDSE